jgi:hypothetical protein
MAKVRAESEAKAAQTESDLLQAHTKANQLAQQRIVTAQNLKLYVEERVQDELSLLELERKNCDAQQGERNVANARRVAEQQLLEEVEKRIYAENQARVSANQRIIAEQLVCQTALDKWKGDKQSVRMLNTTPEFALTGIKSNGYPVLLN